MSYDRLTVRFNQIIEMKKCDRWNNCSNCSDFEGCPKIYDAITRLAKLEDKIENGTLKDLPCKVGDMMYILSDPFFTACIEPVIIRKIEIVGLNRIQVCATGEETHEYYECVPSEYIFKRKLEAEEKLRELRGDK